MNNCKLCGAKVDVNGGGAAIMIAFCVRHTTNMINLSYCKDCYDVIVKKRLKALDDAAELGMYFEEEPEEETNGEV